MLLAAQSSSTVFRFFSSVFLCIPLSESLTVRKEYSILLSGSMDVPIISSPSESVSKSLAKIANADRLSQALCRHSAS